MPEAKKQFRCIKGDKAMLRLRAGRYRHFNLEPDTPAAYDQTKVAG
jgi:hypothetical protein